MAGRPTVRKRQTWQEGIQNIMTEKVTGQNVVKM